MNRNFSLPRFRDALKATPKIVPTVTHWRYMNGLLPSFGVLLVENPDLAQALAEDALDLATKPKGKDAA